jgi:hypothetical protein
MIPLLSPYNKVAKIIKTKLSVFKEYATRIIPAIKKTKAK